MTELTMKQLADTTHISKQTEAGWITPMLELGGSNRLKTNKQKPP